MLACSGCSSQTPAITEAIIYADQPSRFPLTIRTGHGGPPDQQSGEQVQERVRPFPGLDNRAVRDRVYQERSRGHRPAERDAATLREFRPEVGRTLVTLFDNRSQVREVIENERATRARPVCEASGRDPALTGSAL